MKFQKGQSGNPGGKKKGCKNLVNKSLTDQILSALEDRGGEEFLRTLPKPLYISLLRTIAPRTIHQDSTIRFEDGLAEIEKGQEELGTDEIDPTPIGDAENGDTTTDG